jgi:F-type H+-transporting ATPase subunit delta
MFFSERWAAAFINSLGNENDTIEDGIEALKALASWTKALNGELFGSAAAEKLEKLIRSGFEKTYGMAKNLPSPAPEAALKIIVLLVRKNYFRHIDSVIVEAQKLLGKKNGIVSATLEYALPPQAAEAALATSSAPALADEPRIIAAIKKRTGAARVELERRINSELIGGYRLQIGDEIIDASVRSQLRKLESRLASGFGGI